MTYESGFWVLVALVGVVSLGRALSWVDNKEKDVVYGLGRWLVLLGRFALVVVVLSAACGAVHARDRDGRYAGSPLKSWFDSLRSGKGPCCSDADGTALSDVDWQTTKDGRHYQVRIEGQWWDVPDEAVITEPNRAERTMVWPIYYRAVDTPLRVEIRCFMPGSGT